MKPEPQIIVFHSGDVPCFTLTYTKPDAIYKIPDFERVFKNDEMALISLRLMFQNFMAHGFKKILNAGCGDDMAALDLLGATSMDMSEEVIEKHSPKFRDFVKGSVYDIPFPDKSFDCSALGDVLEHLSHPERAVSELKRVTRKRIVVTVPSKDFDDKIALPGHNNLAEYRFREMAREFIGYESEYYTRDQILELVKKIDPLNVPLDHLQRFDHEQIKKLFPGADMIYVELCNWIGYLISWDL